MARPRQFPVDPTPADQRCTLARFPSVSSPGYSYEIREMLTDGFRYCTCWPWVTTGGRLDGDGCLHFAARPDLQRSPDERARLAATRRLRAQQGVPLDQLFPAVEERVPGYVPPGERLEID